jgi:hypothetical protein
MFSSARYRAQANEAAERVKTARNPTELRELRALEQSYTTLADNEQWLADNHEHTLRPMPRGIELMTLAQEEEYVLRCLGAAVIMEWSTMPTSMKRQLFDHASAMGELLDIVELRGQIARFLHKHKDGEAQRQATPPANATDLGASDEF